MDIVLTGGTGYVGRAVLARLVEQGHAVQAVVRSDASAVTVEAAGARAVRGDLLDADWLAGVLADADGLIHAAAAGDADDARRNDAVIDAATRTLVGKPCVLTGGVWTHGSGDDLADDGPQDPPAITAWRPEGEQRVLSYNFRGRRFDCGSKLGYLQAQVEFALAHDEVGEEFSAYLEELAARRSKGNVVTLGASGGPTQG